ncbi:T9SS type A sorting domain-containing protein [Flavobacterium sp. MAH-1]|uniref:T9SS type A sorting domain-containing protein n=1 Tax=Flavobacterium agri TaxID=2743471 RepID=A0A7Y8Y2B1_9FLAO|nr:T9SS type A sorting domain-containing protein [Flavobacterium agri]NUY81098.1 T9SS type A sorting domain-containing protein [Flavobacterium agri]NYA71122.1 T9SS type A sorting domain-containing protein [Flavobacterium agri]
MKKILLLLVGVPFMAQSQCWDQISSLNNSVLIQKSDGSLWGYGTNNDGSLGSAIGQINAPVVISADADWASFSSSPKTSLAIKSDGSLWAWGINANTFGNGSSSTTPVTSPQIVTQITDVASVSTDGSASFAVKQDGSLWAWGSDQYEKLGLGSGDQTTSSAVQIGTDTDWVSVKTCVYFVLALKSDGTLWGWGRNSAAQLGQGYASPGVEPDEVYVAEPVEIGDGAWAQFCGYERMALAIKTDGTLWSWGYSGHGALGLGQMAQTVLVPTQIGSDNDWSSVSTAGQVSAAIKTNGALYTWGIGMAGALGNGSLTWTNVPGQVGTATNWTSVGNSYVCTFASNSQGQLYDFGYSGNWGYQNYYTPLVFTSADCSLGIGENPRNFSVWPNPVDRTVSIAFDGNVEKFRLIDASGRVVIQGSPVQNQIDLAQLSGGLYFLEIESDGKSYRTKLLKK